MNAPPRIALIGNGAMALEIFELMAPNTFSVGFSDPAYAAGNRVDLPQCTEISALSQIASHYALAIANMHDRSRMVTDLENAGLRPCAPILAPGAIVSPSAVLSAGTLLGNGVQVGARCKIGPHNLLMHNVVFGHDSQTGVHGIFSPGVFIAGYVSIGDRVTIQANAAIARSLTVGDGALIGQGASCFRSVPAGASAIGNPARIRIQVPR